jgi:endonuclease G, mitochondrial
MLINTEIVNSASARIERSHSVRLRAPIVRAPGDQLTAESLQRVTNYVNVHRATDDTAALERAMGTNDLVSLYYLWAGIRAARSVGRIQIAPAPGDKGGSATGFMIAPNILLTNWHVFKTREDANRSRVQFAFESDSQGNERVTTSFAFRRDGLFENSKDLDYCVVAVDPATKQGPDPLSAFGWLRLNPQLGKTAYGQFLSIIQHPGGQAKQIAIRENELYPFDDGDDFLTYKSDTFRGSSGSPVCNDLWDVVALHHSGKPLKDAQGNYIGHDGLPITDRQPEEHEIKWIANEGARVSRIVKDLLGRNLNAASREELSAAFDGKIKPEITGLESEATAQPRALGRDVSFEGRPPAAPEGGFMMVLPLNVSLRVEAVSRTPAIVEPPRVAAPAVQRLDATDELVLEKLNFDIHYSNRAGYDEKFLGAEMTVKMPTIAPSKTNQIAPTKKKGKILHYNHFSIMMHAKRRMPVLSAGNVDYSKDQRKVRGRDTFGKDEWIIDTRMDERYQLSRDFYDRWKKLDYGHLVRRDDNCWGASKAEIEFANSDTFHLTNCTPQHESFNRDMFQYDGLWGRLENHISKQATGDRALARLCVLAGPIFGAGDLKLDDEDAGDVYVPLAFWKVVVAPTKQGGLRAFGFITSQSQDLDDAPPFEEFTPEGFEEEQASLAKIEEKTIVRFSAELKQVDAMHDHPDGNELLPLASLDEVWLGGR